MNIEGVPVAQTTTVAFESALAEAISSETGAYSSDNATVVVSDLRDKAIDQRSDFMIEAE